MRGRVSGMWHCWGHRPHCQPPRPSGGKGVAPRCHWALAGHGESGWACAGASVGVLPRAQRAAEGPFDRGWPAVSSARRPSQACRCTEQQALGGASHSARRGPQGASREVPGKLSLHARGYWERFIDLDLKGVKPPVEFGKRIRDSSPGHAGKEGPQLARTGASQGFPRAAAPVGFSPEARRGSQGASREVPGKLSLHARGYWERFIALEYV